MTSPATAAVPTCVGCGSILPPTKPGRGRPRKWCTDRCRKLTLYAHKCINCGAVCNTDGRVTNASVRCASCSVEWSKTDIEHARRAAAWMRGRITWTDEEILDAIRRTAKNGIASKDAYNLVRDMDRAALPSVTIIVRRFGRWASAVEAAGLNTLRGGHEQGYANRRSERALLAAVRACADEIGSRPTVSEYDAWARANGQPSVASIRGRLGGWMVACERALRDASPADGVHT